MKYLKKYYGFFECDGSGDIIMPEKNIKRKRKKGNPSQISDLRNLKKETRIKKIKESYNDIDEYINDIISVLSDYNVRPVTLDSILNRYYGEIENNYNNGKFAKIYAEELVKELDLDSGGYPVVKLPSSSNNVIKYL